MKEPRICRYCENDLDEVDPFCLRCATQEEILMLLMRSCFEIGRKTGISENENN